MTGFILTTHADRNPLVSALRAEGVDVRSIQWDGALPNLAGCQAFYGNLFDEIKDWSGLVRVKRQLRESNVPYIFWNRDAPWNTGIKFRNTIALKLIKPVDIYLAHSLQDKELFGGESHYFPNAASPLYYRDTNLAALAVESTYEYDVSLFGSFGNRKDRNARLRKKFLDELSELLKLHRTDIRFLKIDASQQHLTFDQQMRLIRSSKINLNLGAMCDLPDNPSWGLPERVFGIPAAGGLVISDTRMHLTDSFSEEIVPVFNSPQTCANLIKCLLNDWDWQRRLAKEQHDVVIARHTYQHRVRTLLEYLQHYRTRVGAKS